MDVPLMVPFPPLADCVGMVTLVRNDLASRLNVYFPKPQEWDVEGRIVVVELEEKESQAWKMAIINVLLPEGRPQIRLQVYSDSGFDSDSRRNHQIVDPFQHTHHHFRRLLQRRLLGLVKGYEADGFEVLVIGDMNLVREPRDCDNPSMRFLMDKESMIDRGDFNALFLDEQCQQGMRGIDTFRWIHGNSIIQYSKTISMVSRHDRAFVRTDRFRTAMGILSRTAAKALVSSDVLGPRHKYEEDGYATGHVPIKVVINTSMLVSGPEVDDNCCDILLIRS